VNYRISSWVFAVLALGLAPCVAATLQESLLLAIDTSRVSQIESLIKDGADPNALDSVGEPLLVHALRADEFVSARALIGAQTLDVNRENTVGENALMVASYKNQPELVERLLARDAEVNHTGWTALHYAAAIGAADIVKLLIEHSAYVDAESPNGTTPLMMAARKGDRAVCKLLIDGGADPSGVNQAGMSASTYAAKIEDQELADWLERHAQIYKQLHHDIKPALPLERTPLDDSAK
jgi:uncharacterized protein